MDFLSKILGSSAAQPIEAIGNVFDKLFTSDEERMKQIPHDTYTWKCIEGIIIDKEMR